MITRDVAAEEDVLLQRETFREFPVGAFPHDYWAWGEYHYWPIKGYRGAWYEPTTHHSWNSPRWSVLEVDGKHLMVQSSFSTACWPMLVTGDPDWRDYQVSGTVRPLSLQGPCGLVLRYHDSRNFYSFGFDGTGNSIQLLRHQHEGTTVLAEMPFSYDCDTTYVLSVRAKGEEFVGLVDGIEQVRARDATPGLEKGRIGLWAICPARFGDIEVKTTLTAYSAFLDIRDRREKELDELRARNPKPVLWKTISTTGFGAGRHIRFGDLDGDGRLEILVIQHVKMIDGGNYPMISCLTALDLDGNILWRIGEPSANPEAGLVTADVCCQIYDLDGDGHEEVIYTKDYMINVADGRTGKLKYQAPTPVAPPLDRYVIIPDNPTYRITGDALYFCNLRGGSRAADLIIKNRYNQIWAYDERLNPLWTHQHNTGHFMRAYDIDGDGHDEVMSGYTLMDHDGSIIWDHEELHDHADEIAIGRFDPDRDDVQIAEVCGEAGFIIFDQKGDILFQDHIGHAQRLAVAKYRPELAVLQYYVVTFWGNAGIILLYDAKGQRLHSFEPTSTGNVLSPVNWTGDGQEYALLTGSVKHGGLIDGWGRRVVVFPDDGHPDLCAEALDLTGDPRDELVVWDADRIFIYTQDQPFRGERIYTPLRSPHCNFSNYRADQSLPSWRPWRVS